MISRWTSKLQLIYDEYTARGADDLAKVLGCSRNHVRTLASQLGISRPPRSRPPSDEERIIIRVLYPACGAKRLSKMLGLTYSRIHFIQQRMELQLTPGARHRIRKKAAQQWVQKRRELNREIEGLRIQTTIATIESSLKESLRQHACKPVKKNARKRWTEAEDEQLRNGALQLHGRTPKAVAARRIILGLRSTTLWTPEMHEMVRREYRDRPLAELAADLGVTVGGLSRRAHDLGVKKRKYTPSSPWSDSEEAYLRSQYGKRTFEAIARKLKRTEDACAMRASKLGISKRNLKGNQV